MVFKEIAVFCELTKLQSQFLMSKIVYSEYKGITITNAHFTNISGHFSANCMVIFHKTEVQRVILRCSTGLNLDWLKIYRVTNMYLTCGCDI